MDDRREVLIRPECAADYPDIDSLVAAAFESDVEVRLVHQIRIGGGYRPELALVATIGPEVAGHVMVSNAWLVDGTDRHHVVTLSPLAVAPIHQKCGIGGALVREVVARADEAGEPLVVLEGSPAYYTRFGFEPSAPLGITMTLPTWASPEAAQVIWLRAYDGGPRGHLHFDALGAAERPARE